jgi:hypothetical protein
MWSLESPLNVSEPLEAHLKWLQTALSPHHQFLLSLRDKAKVDIYCSFTVYRDQNGLTFAAEILKLFTELNIPLSISILALLPDESPESANNT